MSGMLTIFKKELKGFYFSPTFWMICFLLSLVFSWIYPIQLNLFAQLLTNFVMQQDVPKNLHKRSQIVDGALQKITSAYPLHQDGPFPAEKRGKEPHPFLAQS